ncbi:hypothetical protein B0H17DRAFT_1092373 [Mycena rosella]|uniref:Uncharacterized protein n=1 Tax=Mycena rosella TaxID=1033263 RepID=A0AAD7CUN1_MYCRO|nr:hypothetical protein B0H17DRAFT_1092373 [Mycena rosella]
MSTQRRSSGHTIRLRGQGLELLRILRIDRRRGACLLSFSLALLAQLQSLSRSLPSSIAESASTIWTRRAPCSRRSQAPVRFRRAPAPPPTPTASSNPWAYVPLSIPSWTPFFVGMLGYIVYGAWKAPRPGHMACRTFFPFNSQLQLISQAPRPDVANTAPAKSASSSADVHRRPGLRGYRRTLHGPQHAKEQLSVGAGGQACSGSRGGSVLVGACKASFACGAGRRVLERKLDVQHARE